MNRVHVRQPDGTWREDTPAAPPVTVLPSQPRLDRLEDRVDQLEQAVASAAMTRETPGPGPTPPDPEPEPQPEPEPEPQPEPKPDSAA